MAHEPPLPGPSEDTANVHMEWHGRKQTVPVPIPLGPRTPLDLLPAARMISERATALALEEEHAHGKEISCCAGCGACCRQLVAISVVEAQSLVDLIDTLPAERQAVIRGRFAQAIRRMEEAGLLDAAAPRGSRAVEAPELGSRQASLQAVARRYFQMQVPCPFLEDESCSIHPHRPLVCREHHVTTPAANCAKLYQEAVPIERVEPPVRLGEALARTLERVGLGDYFMIPLVMSLEWSQANAPLLRKTHDGMTLFQTMMGELGKE